MHNHAESEGILNVIAGMLGRTDHPKHISHGT